MKSNDGQRIDALEMRIAEQDRIIDDLNMAVSGQWKTIALLTKRLGHLEDEMAEAEIGARDGAPERPPPHY